MPCYEPRDDARTQYNRAERKQEKIDELTDLLCKAGRAHHNSEEPPEEVKDWWESHKEWDKSRGEEW